MHTLVMNKSSDIFLSFLHKLIQMIMIFLLLGIGVIMSFCVASNRGNMVGLNWFSRLLRRFYKPRKGKDVLFAPCL